MGHIGNEPDVRFTAAGRPVVKISVATNHSFKTADNEWKEETDWHKIVVFGPAADRLRDRLTKGDLVLVEGRLKRNKWKAEDGTDRSTIEVVARMVRVLGRLARSEGPMEPLFDEQEGANGGSPSFGADPGRGAGSKEADIPF
jgi:single-strand DNA-binding protein